MFKSFPTDQLKLHLRFYQTEMFHSGNLSESSVTALY